MPDSTPSRSPEEPLLPTLKDAAIGALFAGGPPTVGPAAAIIRHLIPHEVLAGKRYAIGAQIAQGGMGAILDAEQRAIERRVAMKVMLEANEPVDVVRFVDEAKITGQLAHPNIVPVYELGVDEAGQLFYTMKLVRGVTLKKVLELLAQGVEETVKKYPLPVLLTVFQKACDAIAFAHAKGVIHRDLKPENLMLGDFGEVLVMDWGLAKVLVRGPKSKVQSPKSDEAQRSVIASARGSDPHFGSTMSGTVMGTPAYMAPEQARGEVERMDQRADIYALGAILFEILHLRPPLTGDDAWAVVEKAQRGEVEWTSASAFPSSPPSLTRQKQMKMKKEKQSLPLPDSLLAVCHKALALDPAQRYQHVADLQADIAAYQNGFATRAENAGLWKQTVLLIKRHKGVFATAAAAWVLIMVLAVWFVVNVTRERNRAEKILADLRATAPTFFHQAKLLTEQENFEEALEKIGIALQLDADNASFHAQRANILQSQERFAEAAAEYDAAAKLNAREPHAAENAALSRTLAAAKEKDGELSVSARTRWRDTLVQQGRTAEAIFAGRGLNADLKKMQPAWQAKLDAWLGKDSARVNITTSEGYDLDLSSRSLTDISPLRGMPFRSLILDRNSHLSDLSPLADSILALLSANNIPDLLDLSPLKGKALRTLDISATNVRDLSPLAGMPLANLHISGTAISDLTPLRGMKLKSLYALNTQVRDLEPLRGQPLGGLHISGSNIISFEPVGDAPLLYLEITSAIDLAVLHQRLLRLFRDQGDSGAGHLEVLAEMKELEEVVVPSNFSDPELLRKLPKLRKVDTTSTGPAIHTAEEFFRRYDTPETRAVRAALAKVGLKDVPLKRVEVDPTGRLIVGLSDTTITDVSPLHGLPINELRLNDTPLRDLEPLRGMPLDFLAIGQTKVTSLEPLRGMPLKVLHFNSSSVTDVSLLAEIPTLEEIFLPMNARNIERLRSLPKLRYISTRFTGGTPGHPAQTAEEFWKEFDAKKAGGK